MRIPVHVVSGFLGAGKTTLLLDQLKRRRERERCAVVVNDFGDARIDATLLGGQVAVTEIAGGCVCCTAPDALVPALRELLVTVKPDRVFVEATGLARPADIIDTLRRSALAEEITLMPVVVVVDPERLLPEGPPLLLEQVDAADVVVLNRASEASEAAWAAWATLEAEQFPPLLAVQRADRGVVPEGLFALQRSAPIPHHDHADHQHSSTEGYSSASRVWPADLVFDAQGLREVLEASGALRVKGLFRTDLGWYRLDRVGDQVGGVSSPLRSASAVDVIVEGAQAEADAVLERLDAARYRPPPEDEAPVLRVEGADGFVAPLTRYSLAALPGQVADIEAVVPGRVGQGVLLSEVLALGGPAATFTLVASDGMTTEPLPISEVGDALVAHSRDGGAFPEEDGGPYRVFVPPKGDGSACKNVKKLARVVLR